MNGHGEKLTRKQEQAIAALLECSTVAEAARKAGVSHSTLKRWILDPAFEAAYRGARREALALSVGRIQAATGVAADTLLAVAKNAAKDSDRVRAAVALLDHALKGGDLARPGSDEREGRPVNGTGDVVMLLAERLRQVDAAELPTAEKARLTATLADALLRAIGVDVLDKRLEALQAVLVRRKDNELQ
jgi:transposase-like protein